MKIYFVVKLGEVELRSPGKLGEFKEDSFVDKRASVEVRYLGKRGIEKVGALVKLGTGEVRWPSKLAKYGSGRPL